MDNFKINKYLKQIENGRITKYSKTQIWQDNYKGHEEEHDVEYHFDVYAQWTTSCARRDGKPDRKWTNTGADMMTSCLAYKWTTNKVTYR